MAYAAARFAERCLVAMSGAPVRLCAYVESPLVPGLRYFASPLLLGPRGVEQVLPLPPLNAFEARGVEELKAELASSIKKGEDFVASA